MNLFPSKASRQAARPLQIATALLAAIIITLTTGVQAAQTTSWIGTWTASPQVAWKANFILPTNAPSKLFNQTVRQTARISLGGRRIRIVLSNEYGTQPLVIGAAHIALAGAGSAIVPGTDRTLTFSGTSSITIPPGAPIVSDPVDLAVAPLASVAISLFIPEKTSTGTFHWDGRQTAYLTHGNQTAAERLSSTWTTNTRLFLSGIQVDAPEPSQSVITLGDSITDGNGATPNANSRWPDFLAARLAPRNIAVLNAGISGARLLGDKMGSNALARFDRDVLSQPHVKAVIVLLGINDISWPGTAFAPKDTPPTLDALIAGYRQLITRAHTHGVKIIGATLTPFQGALHGTPLANYYNKDKEKRRQQVNAWIRTSGEFDAVLDFDKLLRDPEHPTRLLPQFDSGDHLHPGDKGNKAMADAVNLM